MPHHFSEIAVIMLIASLVAVICGKFKQQPLIGYVLAGVFIGPAMLGLIHDGQEISFIAELGVILLLFILGMELPLQSFRKTYKTAVPAALLLVMLSLAATFCIGLVVDLSLPEKITYGFIISLSSTAVAVKLLEDVDLLQKPTGQIAISLLIMQDLLFVPMIMTLGAMSSSGGFDWTFVPKMLGAVAVFIGLIAYLSKKGPVNLLFRSTIQKHKDLIPVAALTWCFAFAGASEVLGFSPAFGAFMAGLVIGNSTSKDAVIAKIEPMQSVLLMVFFLSIGVLIDFQVIQENWVLIGLLLLGTLVFKTICCIFLLKSFMPQDRWKCSFVTGLTISQIGEFSFILAATALGHGIFDTESYKIIIAVIALSLSVSPIWMALLRRFVEVAYKKKASQNIAQSLRMMARA